MSYNEEDMFDDLYALSKDFIEEGKNSKDDGLMILGRVLKKVYDEFLVYGYAYIEGKYL